MSEYDEVLGALGSSTELGRALRGILDREMPNIPFPTMGGRVFWNTIASRGGYKLQQNMFTGHARILNSDDVRIAWGGIDAMTRVMDRMLKYMKENDESRTESGNGSGSLEAMKQLKQLKELLDMNAITQQEFDRKKAALMDRI